MPLDLEGERVCAFKSCVHRDSQGKCTILCFVDNNGRKCRATRS